MFSKVEKVVFSTKCYILHYVSKYTSSFMEFRYKMTQFVINLIIPISFICSKVRVLFTVRNI